MRQRFLAPPAPGIESALGVGPPIRDTPVMEPGTYRLDREALLADRLEATLRVRRETDEIVAAAWEKRRAFVDRLIAGLLADLELERERESLVADLLARVADRPAAVARHPAVAPAGQPQQVEFEPLRLVQAAAG